MDQKLEGFHLSPEPAGGISDHSLQIALTAGGVGLWEWHPESRNLAVSPHLESLLGYPSHTFDGSVESFLGHLLPVDRQRLEHAVSAAAELGKDIDLEFRVIDLTGLSRWFWAKGRALHEPDRRDDARRWDDAGNPGVHRHRAPHAPPAVRPARLFADAAHHAAPAERRFRAITEVAGQQLQTERTGIWLLEERSELMRCVSLYHRNLAQHTAGATLKIDAYPAYFRALDRARALAASDAQHDPATAELAADYLAPLGITSMLEATVRRGGKLDRRGLS